MPDPPIPSRVPVAPVPSTSTSTSSPQPHSSSPRQPRPPSVTSMRQYHRTSKSHSRRQSLDIQIPENGGEMSSTSSSPIITYFPHPSTFAPNLARPTSSPPQPSPSSSRAAQPGPHPSMATSRPPSIVSSTEDELHHATSTSTLRTPRLGHVDSAPMSSSASSPRTRRSSTVDTAARRVSSHTHTHNGGRQLSTPLPGYGATSDRPIPPPLSQAGGLGLHADPALSSPRRISTSHNPNLPPSTTQRGTHSPLTLPTHEAYYAHSQPSTTTTPRFPRSSHGRSNSQHHHHQQQYGSLLSPSTSGSGLGLHRRNRSNGSNLGGLANSADGGAKSPAGSVLRRLRSKASVLGLNLGGAAEYDARVTDAERDEEEDEDEEGMRTNGTRVWYSSYVTIDWIHDAIKESSRVRRLRHHAHRSVRGSIANAWDRAQGWIAVTIIGIVSAVIAFLIIRMEMALFDLKEGFCSTSWGTAKRFCCPSAHHREDDVCTDWVEWGEFLDPREPGGREGAWYWGWPEWVSYGLVALALATFASTMTIHLSSSTQHQSYKDSHLLSSPVTPMATKPARKSSAERQPLLDSSSNGEEEPDEATPTASAFRQQKQGPSGAEPPRKVMYYAAGSGIPEIKTILSGFVIHGYLGGWTLVTKSVGLALSVASGLSLGKEGPLVHISCCVGNIVSRLFIKFECNEAKRREILSCACAAGVSVAFGAPIGGVLFSLEEVSYYFPPKVMWRSFWCAAIAAITLRGLNPFGNGSLVLFEVTYTKTYHYWEFIIFIVLGVFGGVYGAIFSRLNILWAKSVRQKTWIARHPIVEVLLVTALTTVVSFLNPYCRMGGTELVASLFAECHPGSTSRLCVSHPREIAQVVWAIATALLIKGALTIITFGIKLPAGIFIPSLVVGACFGRIVGLCMEWVEYVHPQLPIWGVCRDSTCVLPGLYSMIGAAATLAGVTRTTVSLAVIMLELTGTLNYVVPVMLAVLVAKTVADGLEKKGIYDLVIDLNQLPYLDSKHEHVWGSRLASEVAQRDCPVLRADKAHTVRSLTGKLLEAHRLGMADVGFPVLVKEVVVDGIEGRQYGGLRVVGLLGMDELEHALTELADEPGAQLNLLPEDAATRARSSVMSIFSFAESYSDGRHNPYDISRYINRAPITVQTHSPLELVQQLFVKLGARQLLVTDARGVFRGMITKKAWLSFLGELEEAH